MSDGIPDVTMEDFDAYVETLTNFYEAMKEEGHILDYNMKVNREELDIKVGVSLNTPISFVKIDLVEYVAPKDDGKINLMDDCDD